MAKEPLDWADKEIVISNWWHLLKKKNKLITSTIVVLCQLLHLAESHKTNAHLSSSTRCKTFWNNIRCQRIAWLPQSSTNFKWIRPEARKSPKKSNYTFFAALHKHRKLTNRKKKTFHLQLPPMHPTNGKVRLQRAFVFLQLEHSRPGGTTCWHFIEFLGPNSPVPGRTHPHETRRAKGNPFDKLHWIIIKWFPGSSGVTRINSFRKEPPANPSNFHLFAVAKGGVIWEWQCGERNTSIKYKKPTLLKAQAWNVSTRE